jgi:cytoskeletal protein RodZ|tara:strand:+ start:326 stop:1156 length:831 start_codon:yes stop_codon:yes gene_type:complete
MQSIGERLEEARKRKGISLREAAEATKIRSDFLGYIEQNKMDFDLPEIYKRGFLKNYARYLKLDHDKIMTDYNAQQLSKSRLGKKGGSEWFGQMEVEKATGEESPDYSDSEEHPSFGRITAKPARPEAAETNEGEDETDKTFYMKIGLVFVGTLALVFVVFGLIWAILGSSSEDMIESPELRDNTEISQPANPAPLVVDSNSITLLANGGSVYVTVTQKNDGSRIYRGAIEVDSPLTLNKSGPVEIVFTRGEHLVIKTGDELFRPRASGASQITIE